MHAYIVTTHQKLEPFGEHPRDCLVGNVPLHRVQDTALQRAGLKPIRVNSLHDIRDEGEHLILEDRLFFTPELISTFVERSRALKSRTRCGLKAGVVTESTGVATQGLPHAGEAYLFELLYSPQQQPRDRVLP